MRNNFQPAEDIFDDVEGHGLSARGIETPETDDVEGHMPRVKVPVEAEETDDRGPRPTAPTVSKPPTTDDVEGHGGRAEV